MQPWKKGLTINGQKFNYKELLEFSSNNIVSADTEPWEKEIYRFIITWLSDRDYIIQYSSGTTGRPKQINLLKNSMISSAVNTCEFFNLKINDTALLCMPVGYIAGKMLIVRSQMCDLNLCLTPPKSVPDISSWSGIDFCAMVPMQVSNLLMCQQSLDPIKKLIIGGAEISPELYRGLINLPVEVYATYGMAETCSHIALRKLNGNNPQEFYETLPGVSVTVDERSCLVIEAAYLPNKVVTNDLVDLVNPSCFKWKGRYDNLINSGGIKIVPEEVESLIMEKTMAECMVLGLPDTKYGQKLVFVFEENKITSSLSALKSDLTDILPRYWKPKELFLIKSFPRNDSFKIDRAKLLNIITTKFPGNDLQKFIF